MLPIPPTIIIMNAVMRTGLPMCGVIRTNGAITAPPAPAIAALITMANMDILPMLMPCSAAASGFCAHAFMAQPSLVRVMNSQKPPSINVATAKTSSLEWATVTLSMPNTCQDSLK